MLTPAQRQALLQRRTALLTESDKLRKDATDAKRELTPEEVDRINAIVAELQSIAAQVSVDDAEAATEEAARSLARTAPADPGAGASTREAGTTAGAGDTTGAGYAAALRRRGELMASMLATRDAALAANRAMTAQEIDSIAAANAEMQALATSIQTEEASRSARRDAAETADRGRRVPAQPQTEQSRAFRDYLLSGALRTQSLTVAEAGGVLAPEDFANDIIMALNDISTFRPLATAFPLRAGTSSFGAPMLSQDLEGAAWGSEIAEPKETMLKFSKRKLEIKYQSLMVLETRPLLRTVPSVEQLIRDRLALKADLLEDRAFWAGSGMEEPLGALTVSDDGVPASRNRVVGPGSGAAKGITVEGILDAYYALKKPYRARATWAFNEQQVKAIRKLKDGDGRYLWQPSIVDGEPDRLFGRPVVTSDNIPEAVEAGATVGMFADFSNYWILDSLGIEIERLDEMYARSNRVAFIMRKQTDGAPVLSEAFVRLVLS